MNERKRSPRWKKLAAAAALPAGVAALCVLLLGGAFALPLRARAAQLVAFSFLAQVAALLGVRRLRREAPLDVHVHAEEGAFLCVAALAIAQATGGVGSAAYALLYLLGAAFVLAHPLPLALGLIGFALVLDGALFGLSGTLRSSWPLLAAHAGFVALFAALYHALLAARLAQARRNEQRAVRLRVAEAERRAREYRLVATAEAATEPPEAEGNRSLLAAVGAVEDSIRGALRIAEDALAAHTAALFLTHDGGETLRLRECVSLSEKLYRGPLPAREGALGAALGAAGTIRLEGDGASLTYYEGPSPVGAFVGAPIPGGGGVLAVDRDAPFGEADERIALELAAQIGRAMEAERVLSAVRREKDEKARFFRALDELNRATTAAQAAEAAVAQARALCPALDLVALTLLDHDGAKPRHRVAAALGEGADVLQNLHFAENGGLVCNVVKLGAPLPARAPAAMERVQVFDAATSLRGLAALKVFPLRAGDETVGALVCASHRAEALPEAAQRELQLLAAQAASALQRARLHDRAERLATTDGLTGLVNRRTLDAQLAARVSEARRYRRPLSLVLIDIDHFKKVNDVHGHQAGDAVLRGVAATLAAQARGSDLAARYGGEELCLVLPHTDAAGARTIAERVRSAIAAAAHRHEGGALQVTVSLGVSTLPADGESPEALIESADRALYRAKQAGRNRVEVAAGRAAA